MPGLGHDQVRAAEALVAAGGLAALAGGLREVAEVVERLVGVAPGGGQAVESDLDPGAGAGQRGGQQQGEAEQRRRLAGRDFERVAAGAEVEIARLAVEDAAEADVLLQPEPGLALARGGQPGGRLGDQRVRAVDERQAGEDRGALAVEHVRAGAAAALAGVVHRRQVVEDQGGGMQILDRHRGRARRGRLEPERPADAPGELGADQAPRRAEQIAERAGEVRLDRRRGAQTAPEAEVDLTEIGRRQQADEPRDAAAGGADRSRRRRVREGRTGRDAGATEGVNDHRGPGRRLPGARGVPSPSIRTWTTSATCRNRMLGLCRPHST